MSKNKAQMGKDCKAVIEFLESCTAYEADAFRIMVGVVKEQVKMEEITPSESALLNSYLNDGCFKEGTDNRKLEKHRKERARNLMMKVDTFVKDGNKTVACYALYDFAASDEHVRSGLQTLLPKPKDAHDNGQPTLDFNAKQ